jgi:hypothetical protein
MPPKQMNEKIRVAPLRTRPRGLKGVVSPKKQSPKMKKARLFFLDQARFNAGKKNGVPKGI